MRRAVGRDPQTAAAARFAAVFDARARQASPAGAPQAGVMAYFISTATSADARSQGAAVAVLPVGSFEQHGDFLPLATDTIVACLIAQRIAADYDLFLLPPVTISCSHEHAAFPGTVSVSAATMLRDRRRRAGVAARAGYRDSGPGQRARRELCPVATWCWKRT